MNKEFIPYEQALELKELGFDEPCFGYYQGGTNNLITEQIIKSQGDGNWCLAPTFSQAFRWFREKHKLEGLVLPKSRGAVIDGEPIYFIAIISYENELMTELFNSTNQKDLLDYNPKEEAELACLIKLIEIIKKTKQ